MCYEDFMKIWDTVEMCHLSMDSFSDQFEEKDDDSDLGWQCTVYQDEWKIGESAGGCGNGDMSKLI